MNQTEKTFTYWKKPWAPWAIFVATFLNGASLLWRIQEFRDIARPEIYTELFSQEAWANYVVTQHFQWALSGIIIVLFLGCLVVGTLAHSQRQSDLYMGILFGIITLLWGSVAIIVPVFSQGGATMIWLILMGISLMGCLHGFCKAKI